MSKRKPTSELNDRNWDDEEEPEEAGTFRLAGQDVLKNRTIRKAKRSLQTESSSSGSIFAGFALKTSDSSFPKPSLSTGVTLNFGSNLTFQPKSNGTSQKSASANKGDSTDNPEYLRQLKVLNENILSWIQKHVGENPYCILTPSFKDYEKHLNDLEKKYCEQGTDSSQDKSSISAPPAASPAKEPSPSVFGSSGKPMGSGFSFGQSLTSSTASKDKTASSQEEKDNKGTSVTSASGFSFGAGSTQSTSVFGAASSTKSTGGFGGSNTATFSFGLSATAPSAAATASGAAKGDEEEEYQPPKVEVREIKEEGAVYTKRCKLFYQKDGQWTDRGVGNLHLKPTENGRTQLIIRADTNLGNILLNILLTSALPTKRQGKNNVFLICVPNPPINVKEEEPSTEPVPMLIRVKTAEDADELLAKLEELKAAT